MNKISNYQILHNLAKMEGDIQYIISMKNISYTSGADKYEAQYLAQNLKDSLERDEITTANTHLVATSVADKINEFLGYKLATVPSLEILQQRASDNHLSRLQKKKDSMQNLTISVSGTAYYWNDDRVYGTYDSESSVTILQLASGISVIDAIRQAEFVMAEGQLEDSVLTKMHDRECYDDDFDEFVGHHLCIVNDDGKVILKASLDSYDLNLDWISPLTAVESIGIVDEIKHLSEEASTEASWDNYETAKRLRQKISNLTDRSLPQEDIDAYGLGDAIHYIRHGLLPALTPSWKNELSAIKDKSHYNIRMHSLSYIFSNQAGYTKDSSLKNNRLDQVFMRAENYLNKVSSLTNTTFDHLSIKDGNNNTLFFGKIQEGEIQWKKPLNLTQFNQLTQQLNFNDNPTKYSSDLVDLQNRLTPDEWFEDKDYQFLLKNYFSKTDEIKPSDLFNGITQDLEPSQYPANTSQQQSESVNNETDIKHDITTETGPVNSARTLPRPF